MKNSIKKIKPDIYVGIEYIGFDMQFDRELNKLARKFKGTDYGSGCGFGRRDINFGFKKNIKSAKLFAKKVKEIERIKVVYIGDYNHNELTQNGVVAHPILGKYEFYLLKGKNPFISSTKVTRKELE